ncbi:hypothetical protein ABT354_35410 [Streptomyces sp. NPDC000594]|uniref:hypothetical protein n=1 Tax=Streptomyces sp. NPDC000594 TaxID=3154261 RepID=UPI00331B347A
MAGRRLRSSTVVLGGMGVLALTITSCGGSEPDRRCADPLTQAQLPSYECGTSTGSGSYYYGGDVTGGTVQGGSFTKSAVERDGFGCSGSGGG